MATGAFRVYQDPGNLRDIRFEIVSGDSVPEDQMRLRDAVDQTLTVIRMLFPERDKRFEEYYRLLLSLAQAGLVGQTAQPEISLRALAALKAEITAREGGRIKNQYMKTLGKYALTLGCPAIALAILAHWLIPTYDKASSVLFLWSGCMAGVWLSFGARKTYLRFEDLHIPEEDRLEPMVRLVFAGLLTVMVWLLLSTKAVVLTLGAITTAQITQDIEVALLVGMICGFSEQALSTRIAKRVSSFLED